MNGPGNVGDVVVVGVGGAGVNAIQRLEDGVPAQVRLVAADTSAQALDRAGTAERVLMVAGTRGWGTGGDTQLGRAAAVAAADEIGPHLMGADFVFVVAGLAGGTGGGAAPEIARMAREQGAVALGFGVEPFSLEGAWAGRQADQARRALADACDAVFRLDTPRAAGVVSGWLALDSALRVADDLLRQAIEGLCNLAYAGGWIDVGAAATREVLAASGRGCVALGVGRGQAPAQMAVRCALASPLADMALLARAGRAMVHIAGGPALSVRDVGSAMDVLHDRLPEGCRTVVGCCMDGQLSEAAKVTLMAMEGIAPAAARPLTRLGRAAVGHRQREREGPFDVPSLDALRTGVPVRQAV